MEKTHTIAVVSFLFSNYFVHEILHGIEPHLFNSPYEVNYYPTTGNPDIERDMLKTILVENRTDALISISVPMDQDLLQEYKNAEIPVVFVEEFMEGAHTVKVDNVKGAYMATEHLIKLGRKKIGFVVGEFKEDKTNANVVERMIGYKKALQDYGVHFDPEKMRQVAYYNFDEGREIMRYFIKDKVEVDAIFCAAGDYVAMGILDEAKVNNNINVPEDLAVIGYDDIIVAPYAHPPLTTVRQPLAEMGSTAFDLAVQCIKKEVKETNKLIILKPELIIRKSA